MSPAGLGLGLEGGTRHSRKKIRLWTAEKAWDSALPGCWTRTGHWAPSHVRGIILSLPGPGEGLTGLLVLCVCFRLYHY